MADAKISALTELAAAPATDDKIPIVDTSDTSEAATGTDKFIQASNLVPVNGAAANPALRTLSTVANTAAPGDGAYTTAGQEYLIFQATSMLIHDQAAATLALVDGSYALASPLSFLNSGAATVGNLPFFRYVSGAHTVTYNNSNLTTSLMVRSQVACNATAPGTMTFIVGLYPVTVAGIADTLTFTLGTVVSGSTVTHTNPGASAIQQANLTTPGVASVATGTYALGVVTNATIANNSAVQVSAQVYATNT